MKIRIFVLPILIFVVFSTADSAVAQPAESRFEVAAEATLLRLSDFRATNAGIGGRLSFDLSRWAALEGESNFYPDDEIVVPPSSLTPNLRVAHKLRRADAFFGV